MPQQPPPERISSGPARATIIGLVVLVAGLVGIAALPHPLRIGGEQLGTSPNGCPIYYVDLRRRGDAFVMVCRKDQLP